MQNIVKKNNYIIYLYGFNEIRFQRSRMLILRISGVKKLAKCSVRP